MSSRALVALAVAMAIAGCANDPTDANVREKSTGPPSILGVSATDFEFGLSTAVVRGGAVRIDFANNGEVAHMMFTDRLKPGRSLDSVRTPLLRPGGADFDAVFGNFVDRPSLGGYPDMLSPGMKTSVTLPRVTSGTYVIICFLESPEPGLPPHFARGMVTSFEVKAAAPVSTSPLSNATILLSNAGIRGIETLTSGRGVVKVECAGRPHSLQLVRLYGSTTPEQAIRHFEGNITKRPDEDPPAAIAGGVSQLGFGEFVFLHVELPPGRYVALDLEPSDDSENALPFHAANPRAFRIPFTVT